MVDRHFLLRLRQKNWRQWVRLIATRVPPVSFFGLGYYYVVYKTWVYRFINRIAIREFRDHPPSLRPEQQTIVNDIRKNGVHCSCITALSERSDLLQVLRQDADMLLATANASPYEFRGMRPQQVRAIGRNVRDRKLPASFVDFFVSKPVLDVVNTCIGQFCRLNYVDVWHNVCATDSDYVFPTEQWHRDHEDINVVKLFVYLSDVTEWNGPFEYIERSHRTGQYGRINSAKPPMNVFIGEGELDTIRADNKHAARHYLGKAGTLIAFDASGYHRGGRPTNGSRTVLVAAYTSDAAVDNHRYLLPGSYTPARLSTEGRYALRV